MSYYANPPMEVTRKGRELKLGTYEDLTKQLKDDEKLFGVYDRFIFKQAVWLYSADEMSAFEAQVSDHTIVRLGFYALPLATANELGAGIPE